MAKFPTHDQILAMPLRQQALAFEEARHRARLKELQQADAAIALLEREFGALKAAGCTLYGSQISNWPGKKGTLYVTTSSIFDADLRLYKALIAVGFSKEERGEGSYTSMTLKKGRLRVRIYISDKDLARAEEQITAAAAQTSAPSIAPEEVQ